MGKFILSLLFLFPALMLCAANNEAPNINMPSIKIPPPPEAKNQALPSYEDLLSQSSVLMEKYISIFNAYDTKGNSALEELKNRCIDSARDLKEDFDSICRKQSAFKQLKYCDVIFEDQDLNPWSPDDCTKIATKLDKLSAEFKQKSEASGNSSDKYESENYRIASGVAMDLSSCYRKLSADYPRFESACDAFTKKTGQGL